MGLAMRTQTDDPLTSFSLFLGDRFSNRLLHRENDDQRCQRMQQAGNGKHGTLGYAPNHMSQAE